jgi:hypothetical protein
VRERDREKERKKEREKERERERERDVENASHSTSFPVRERIKTSPSLLHPCSYIYLPFYTSAGRQSFQGVLIKALAAAAAFFGKKATGH